MIARSAGDLRSAPFPAGATEFVDLDVDAALREGIRYAVMVVNNYGGMPFAQLHEAFAGVMLREDPAGKHFDPRTVALKFALSGDNGIFMPIVVDVRERTLHWLDVHSRGSLVMNTVESSKNAIATICPDLITYFGSGVRPSMFELALLHAAARCPRVLIRGSSIREFVRRPDEDTAAFYARLTREDADEPRSRAPRPDGAPLLAALYRGDLELPDGSMVYVLLREQETGTLSAADLLS